MHKTEKYKYTGTWGFFGFKFALKGIFHFIRSQKNAKVHLFAALFVVIMGFILHLSNNEWWVVVLCIGMVLAAEMFNTSIEFLTDLVSPEFNKHAGHVKDIAAGAVLLTALTAAILGCWIFIPKTIAVIGTWI